MRCRIFNATMSTNACLRRQEWADKLRHIIKLEQGIKVQDHSLITCLKCDQGEAVKKNPDKYINRDFLVLKEKQTQLIRKRGWVFKEGISYETLLDNYDFTMMKVNNGRRNNNGKGKILKKSDRERIIRFIRKHRNFTRSK